MITEDQRTEEESDAEFDLIPTDAFERLAAYLILQQEIENACGDDIYMNRALSVMIDICITKSKED